MERHTPAESDGVCDESDLRASMPVHARPVLELVAALPEVDEDEENGRRRDRRQHPVVDPLPGRVVRGRPGREIRVKEDPRRAASRRRSARAR
jgi:hypothetical protein